ncbi:hypothetical protein CH247_11075 [Rhodococcus sp. 06-156-3b]|nr:hypothetical protein CH247_11075 [Rhodococcus sp. 06-156-3b]
MAHFELTEKLIADRGHTPKKRIVITRTQQNGRTASWEFSPTALRALADQIEDALEPFEKKD